MKIVQQNTSEVYHLFANQIQSNATNQTRTLYFKEKELYSFGSHYKLAQYLKGGAILINNDGYSVTTSKHISSIVQASQHKNQFLTQDVILEDALARVEGLAKKFVRARENKEYLYNTILSIQSEFLRFQDYLSLHKIDSIRMNYDTPKKVKVDKRDKSYKRFIHLVTTFESANFKIEVMETMTKLQEQKKAKQLLDSDKFYNNKKDWVRGLNFDLLRLDCEIGTQYNIYEYSVRTSQNVVVKVDKVVEIIDALVYFDWNNEKANQIFANKKIGYYTINKVANDVFHIGCHKITFKEIKKLMDTINEEYQLCKENNTSTNLHYNVRTKQEQQNEDNTNKNFDVKSCAFTN
tara:strand:+ start:4646 stop:5695 length:1050 start_codon:yes stop_codon:yes gene_type:complete